MEHHQVTSHSMKSHSMKSLAATAQGFLCLHCFAWCTIGSNLKFWRLVERALGLWILYSQLKAMFFFCFLTTFHLPWVKFGLYFNLKQLRLFQRYSFSQWYLWIGTQLRLFQNKEHGIQGGAVAQWSKALQLREKINENQKDPRFTPRPGHL